MRAAIIIVLSALFVSGCLQSISSPSYADDYAEMLKNRIPIYDPDDIEKCDFGKCWCMVCKNGSNIFGQTLTSYVGGFCYMEQDCNRDTKNDFYDKEKTPDLDIRTFMLGQGPTISDYSNAAPVCNYRLGMAVQWLVGDEKTPYPEPDARRAMCLLSKNVIPVYVLYSNSSNIDIAASQAIGEIMAEEGDDFWEKRWSDGPVGPNIIVTEIDFDPMDVHKVAAQVEAIDSACNDRANDNITCWIAVAPRFYDFETLDELMQLPGVKERVDLIAFGVNGSSLDACVNGQINTGKMMNQIRNYTEYALYEWEKPTIIPYVLFDRGAKDKGGCVWEEDDLRAAYSAFWPTGIQSLQKRGLIGIAPYSWEATKFGSVANPLRCFDCALNQSTARARSWYGWCQGFSRIESKQEGVLPQPSGGIPIIFPNASGGFCPDDQGDYLLKSMMFGDAGGNKYITDPRTPELKEGLNKSYACGACLNYDMREDFEPPFDFKGALGGKGGASLDYCYEYYPEIEYWADARSIDPMFVRAVIATEAARVAETGAWDPCSAARVCKAGEMGPGPDGRRCFDTNPAQDECYSRAYEEIYDPREETDPSAACQPTFVNDLASITDDPPKQPKWKWCAFGLMQSVEPPYTFFPDGLYPFGGAGPYNEVLEKAELKKEAWIEEAWACAKDTHPPGQFNPFNASHSLCIGTYKVAECLKFGRIHAKELTEDPKEQDALAGWFCGFQYTGYTGVEVDLSQVEPGLTKGKQTVLDALLNFPKTQKTKEGEDIFDYCASEEGEDDEDYCDVDDGGPRLEPGAGYCYGPEDIIEYYHLCIMPFLPEQYQKDPGSAKMAAYYDLLKCKNNFCPDEKRLLAAACKEDETEDCNPDLCLLHPCRPKIPQSGTVWEPDEPAPP